MAKLLVIDDDLAYREYLERVLTSAGHTVRTQPNGTRAVPLSAEDKRDFYQGAANEILWPLCHGLTGRCTFSHQYWRAYREVNWRFASTPSRLLGAWWASPIRNFVVSRFRVNSGAGAAS